MGEADRGQARSRPQGPCGRQFHMQNLQPPAGRGAVRMGLWAPSAEAELGGWPFGGENNRVPLKRTERVRFAF